MTLRDGMRQRAPALRRFSLAAAGFGLLCAWPLVLFKLRLFGG
jgi:hypothetical protein